MDCSVVRGRKELFHAFIASEHGSSYQRHITMLAEDVETKKYRRLLVNLSDVGRFDKDLLGQLKATPIDFLVPWAEALREKIGEHSNWKRGNNNKLIGSMSETIVAHVQLGFIADLSDECVSPRVLRAGLLGTLIVIEGVVTRCSRSQPKIVSSVLWSQGYLKHITMEYRDATDVIAGIPETNNRDHVDDDAIRLLQPMPSPRCEREGGMLEPEVGHDLYKDQQCITLQEPPDLVPPGHLPSSVVVVLDNDLVEVVKPGDLIRCVGVYRALLLGRSASAAVRTAVIATSLTPQTRASSMDLALTDAAALKETANFFGDEMCKRLNVSGCYSGLVRSNILEVMTQSFSPTVYGHGIVKKALMLQLVGGTERTLTSGSRLRGDINVLLVGDPSTAKSQLLRASMRMAPLAVSTTGRGSSGVGLTATVSNEPETGEKLLEAGAVVLADRGLVCIDEFDKMSPSDRAAIHEVMEQQTVTLSKAGIFIALNARCAILAAANPVYGHYDLDQRPHNNIGLPDSLLSRFDLLFIILDTIDAESDDKIANHVLRSHRGVDEATFLCVDEAAAIGEHDVFDTDRTLDSRTHMYARSESAGHTTRRAPRDPHAAVALPHVSSSLNNARQEGTPRALNVEFLRQCLRYARYRVDPTLEDITRESIATAYADLRVKADECTLPVTARCLESLIRLSTAHAKARLSPSVAISDCAAAFDLVSCALFGEYCCGTSSPFQSHKFCVSPGEQIPYKSNEDFSVPVGKDMLWLNSSIDWCLRMAHQQKKDILSLDELLALLHTSPSTTFPKNVLKQNIESVLSLLESKNRLMYDRTTRLIHLC